MIENNTKPFFSVHDGDKYNIVFDQVKSFKSIALLTNPRYESPTLASYLFQNADDFNFYSLTGSPVPYMIKNSVAFCIENIINIFSGKLLTETLFIVPFNFADNFLLGNPKINVLKIIPYYLQKMKFNSSYIKNEKLGLVANISLSSCKYFSENFFQGGHPKASNDSKISLPIYFNFFDRYLLKNFNLNFFNRLILTSLLIKPPKINNYISSTLLGTRRSKKTKLVVHNNVTVL